MNKRRTMSDERRTKRITRPYNKFPVFVLRSALIALRSTAATFLLIGCAASPSPAPPPEPPPSLTAANQALDSGRSAAAVNDTAHVSRYADDAINDAGSYLHNYPSGVDAAEAYYLQGRGYELRIAADPTERSANLAGARDAYQLALGHQPSPSLEGAIRASLSNVVFFQDDFATAITQASQAMKLVDAPQVKSSLLFRIGVSQQRLSEWTNADRTFNQVIQQYPGTPVAEASRERQGEREFYVQLATFDNSQDADQKLSRLTSAGVIITRRSDAKGHTIADAGPFSTYQDAKKARDQMPGFPGALIVP